MQRKHKPNSTVLLFLSLFLLGSTSLVSASTYGEDVYGGDLYSGTEATEEDGECSRDYPRGEIRITSVSSGDTHLKLVFEGIEAEFNEFEVRWGTNASLIKDSSNSKTFGNRNTRSYVIEDLEPSTLYFLKVRALNGCAEGDWSETVKGRTLDVAGENIVSNTEIVEQTVTAKEPEESEQSAQTPQITDTVALHTLKVRVADVQGNPVAGVSVSITEADIMGVTNNEGLVFFDNIPSGWYEISAQASGVEGVQSVNLNEEGSSVIEVTIQVTSVAAPTLPKPSYIWLVGIPPLFFIIFLLARKFSKKKEQAIF
ncbi:MAG: hypothetical protein UV00_C0024G0011 [candidate division WWE3 bacterium GW2011_GWF1_42_14]|uniref:Fibronectin type-III domain-containing protein n=1 Tax=candidate division WWE3 bacterium GW2011_GWF1_42_14 TaxID=1619138 RepID=A0A0G1ARG1_UNCKA|nr:MAG: hypothetical protein UV00_C0024G0011 [candidate division WWE3 bacterium GW2011_GWF1_42_14]